MSGEERRGRRKEREGERKDIEDGGERRGRRTIRLVQLSSHFLMQLYPQKTCDYLKHVPCAQHCTHL
jgi:hypothetical protein